MTITRENLADGEQAPPVHAPYFPTVVKEGWWLILTEKPKASGDGKKSKDKDKAGEASGPANLANIHAVEKVTEQDKVITHELRFMAPPKAGEYAMDLYVYSDSYMGLDVELEVKFTVLPAEELPEYAPHPEDLELDNEPTLFEQVMAAPLDDSSDEEDEEEEDDDMDLVDSKKKKKNSGKESKKKSSSEGGAAGSGKEKTSDEKTGGGASEGGEGNDAAAGVAAAAAVMSSLKNNATEEEEEGEEEEDDDGDDEEEEEEEG